MGYLTRVQVIERGNGTHQPFMFADDPHYLLEELGLALVPRLFHYTYPRRSVKISPYSCLLMPAEFYSGHPSKGVKKTLKKLLTSEAVMVE